MGLLHVFDSFEDSLIVGDIDGAKKIITRENIHGSVIGSLCLYGPDNPDLLRYYINLGVVAGVIFCNLEMMLQNAAETFKPKMVRALLDCCHIFANECHHAVPVELPLHSSRNLCVLHLLDAKVPIREIHVFGSIETVLLPQWIQDFKEGREKARSVSVMMLGLQRLHSRVIGGNRKDVLRVIARSVWGLRGLENYWTLRDCVARHTRSASTSKKIKKN